MLFNSFGYLLFILIAIPLAWTLSGRARLWMLGAASVLFYAMWRWDFTLLMLFSSLVDFTAAQRIAASQQARVRRGWLVAALTINLSLLFAFKYTYFVSDSLVSAAAPFGYAGNGWRDFGFEIILPLGISFYTFQTISYTIDVYRRVVPATRDFAMFVTYVTFWPQLIAGPILRASEVIPQLMQHRRFRAQDFTAGVMLVLTGLCKKIVLADSIGPMVDAGFATDAALLTSIDVWVMTLLFGFQIYFDFSGYSDVAIGSARMLGIHFPKNFDWPYLARSPRDFWRRWHISLSSWIRDYLYTPLTGREFQTSSEGGIALATDRSGTHASAALFATWFVMGLWHGASWTFAVWGLYHAFVIWVYRTLTPLKVLETRAPVVGWALMFVVAMAGWVPFRAQSLEQTLGLWGKLLDPTGYQLAGRALIGHSYLAAAALTGGFLLFAGARTLAERRPMSAGLRATGTVIAVAVMTVLILTLQRPVKQFIYFQF